MLPDSRPTPAFPVDPVTCKAPLPPDFPPGPSAKKIFIFLDGTGNKFVDDATSQGANSNIVKLYTALKIGGDQVAYYHPGVGTMGDPAIRWRIPRWWSMIKGLAFGAGFKANVLDAYRYLMGVYNDGDQIYIFGFSRGAYTARALASLLHGYGLLCRGNEGHMLYAWRMMIDQLKANRKQLKRHDVERKGKDHHSIKRNKAYAETFSRIVTVRFMGIWDTVSSVGWIYSPIQLLDGAQNPIIQVGRHAVSIDERRAFYRDNLWGKPVLISDPEWPETLRAQKIHQDIAQVWFPGAHSDVGGSYPQIEAAPANEALLWMIEELKNHDAQLCEERIAMVLGTPTGFLSADTAYIPPKPADNMIHQSLKGIWWLLQLFPQQYYAKDDAIIQWRVPFGRPRSIPDGAIVHGSAERRLRETEERHLRKAERDRNKEDELKEGRKQDYTPVNLKLRNLQPAGGAVPGTTANLTGSFVLRTRDGKASVPDDSTAVRYGKLAFGWIFYVLFWAVAFALVGIVSALVVIFLAGLFRIAMTHLIHFLDHQSVRFHTVLHRWLTGR